MKWPGVLPWLCPLATKFQLCKPVEWCDQFTVSDEKPSGSVFKQHALLSSGLKANPLALVNKRLHHVFPNKYSQGNVVFPTGSKCRKGMRRVTWGAFVLNSRKIEMHMQEGSWKDGRVAEYINGICKWFQSYQALTTFSFAGISTFSFLESKSKGML